ncbi:NAD(+) kinase [Sulfodiicoccus acidiphilus]|uniref:NAD kinase n=1 Tax=Sulfodiicoccus acidiphilus TaxID=1670455 RepID=A0A348B1P1_9CREN|nr:NAD(+)/NADH kinase [Sulfodiicoccus acidiphilus]BBD72093.1 NAD(+) kinase [Sulfodiicoccus acidiphilus]GGU05102.1 NAD(+) kinase [Sulfodiicoccus acidiphilus]
MRVRVVSKPSTELKPLLAKVEASLRAHGVDVEERDFDAVVAVGGDGTLLRAVALGRPIIAVRAGKRGLLMDVPPERFEEVVERLKKGDFREENYRTLELDLFGKTYRAFNDVALLTDGVGTATFKVSCGTEFSFDGDGLIVATPQGSTGWSLSAAGPYVDRSVMGTVVTLINPVLTPMRSLVVNYPTVRVSVLPSGEEPHINVVIDGNKVGKLEGEIEVKTNGRPVTIYRFFDFDPVKLILRKDP